MRRGVVAVQAASMIFALCMFGCGVNETKLKNAEQRIALLKEKGVPDSVLSPAVVSLYQLRGYERISAQDRNTRAVERQLKAALSSAEHFYRDRVATLKPALDSLRGRIREARPRYAGLLRKKFDSLAAIADSCAAGNLLLQAHSSALSLADAIPAFDAEARRSRELADSVPGEWECTMTQTGPQNSGIKTRERKLFSFRRDGSVRLTESRSGRSGYNLKEDWEFVSSGKWELCGDTVHLLIDRFGANRRHFEKLVSGPDGSRQWKRRDEPPFDSVITNGSQNRFIAYTDLKADFRKRPR